MKKLADTLGVLYKEKFFFPELFSGITLEKLRDIQKSIRAGTYTLSPLLLSIFSDEANIKKDTLNRRIGSLKDENNDIYYAVT